MNTSPHPARGLALLGLLIALTAGTSPVPAAEPATRPAFAVTFTSEVHPGPISARVYVMLGPLGSPREPRFGPDWFRPQPFFAVDAEDWRPGEPLRIGPDAAGFPGPLKMLAPGFYVAQAIIRLNPDTHRLGNGVGNAYGLARTVEIGREPSRSIPLEVDRVVPDPPFPESDRVRLIDIPSPLLTEFHGRPIRQRAAVVLPEAARDARGPPRRFPTLYIVPGFGGDHRMALRLIREESPSGLVGRDFLRVVLNPDCGTGHHVFADSATNGPRGRALIDELIPHVEAHFPALPGASHRLLTGHSSGGWSTLWLQVTYPEVFGGVWATAPDPVDFRDFQRIDLYAPGANLFRDPTGQRRPIARMGIRPVLWFDDFSRMEDVIGDGGQLHSFEAVFSPRGPNGRPRPLWDRQSGAIDPEVAEAWQAYDLRLILERDWDRLAPQLAGKLHVYTGGLDTFYLEGAVELLGQALERLGSDAVVEIVPGKDHGTLLDAALARRIDDSMRAAVAEAQRPATTPEVPTRNAENEATSEDPR